MKTQNTGNQEVREFKTLEFARQMLTIDEIEMVNDLIIRAKRAGAADSLKNRLFAIHDGVFYAELFTQIDGFAFDKLVALYDTILDRKLDQLKMRMERCIDDLDFAERWFEKSNDADMVRRYAKDMISIKEQRQMIQQKIDWLKDLK
jgi:hypothetical protein